MKQNKWDRYLNTTFKVLYKNKLIDKFIDEFNDDWISLTECGHWKLHDEWLEEKDVVCLLLENLNEHELDEFFNENDLGLVWHLERMLMKNETIRF